MKRVIIRKLVEGHEAATQLKLLLQKPFGADDEGTSISVGELAASVQRSFTDSLSILTPDSAGENGSPAADSGIDPTRSADSGEGRKRSSLPTKNRARGFFKTRRNAQSWTIVSPTAHDNHAWRKYGQKKILNSKFPRSYFRCTRKYDQGCCATKLMQRTQENPELYLTTYIGTHTCKATLKPPHLVMDSNTSFLVNSHPDSNKLLNEHDDHPPSPITKHSKEDTPSSFVTDHMLDSTLWSNLKDFEASKPSMMPLKMASDNPDTLYSSCAGFQSLDKDFGVDTVHFDTHDFHFDDRHEQMSCFDALSASFP